MKIKTMGASPLTGIIYYGTVNTEKGMWVGNKTDGYKMITGRCPVKEVSFQASLIRGIIKEIESLKTA